MRHLHSTRKTRTWEKMAMNRLTALQIMKTKRQKKERRSRKKGSVKVQVVRKM